MKRFRILNGFASMPDAELLITTNSIINAMTLNFPTAPDLPALIDKRDSYSEVLTLALQGTAHAKAVKNEKKAAVVDELHHVGDWVVYRCNNDRPMAMGSGFAISKAESGPALPVGAPSNLVLEDGVNSGELVISFDKVPSAKSYNFQITPDPVSENSIWQSQSGTVRRHTFAGLQSGKRYWCRVQAVGTNGQAVYSEPVSRVSQ